MKPNIPIKQSGKVRSERPSTRSHLFVFGLAVVVSIVSLVRSERMLTALLFFFGSFAVLEIYLYVRIILARSARIHQMEEVFPDFIELMASNLRAGMTIDKALLLSSRKEFYPLDTEIFQLGKDILTGKEITRALNDLAQRIDSEKIKKTIALIQSGINSGGNLAVLLEQTAVSMRERSFVEKRAASNVLMYVIFVFFAVAIGAPTLFALSSILVGILSNLLSNIPETSSSGTIPFTLTQVSVSTTFILYFSLAFILMSCILASFILGLVSKGEEKAGFRYILPLTIISMGIFFLIRKILQGYFSNFFT